MQWTIERGDDLKESSEAYGHSLPEDRSEIKSLILSEDTDSQTLVYSEKINSIFFPNLDASVMRQQVPNLTLVWDPKGKCYCPDEASRSFLKKALIREKQLYTRFGFTRDGDILINDTAAEFSLFVGKEDNILERSKVLYRKYDLIRQAYLDIASGQTQRRESRAMEYEKIILSQKFESSEGEFYTDSYLRFDYNVRSVFFDVTIKSTFSKKDVVCCLNTPDGFLSYKVYFLDDTPVHLGTYIYTFPM